jgi:hypothetical protein
VAAAQRGSAQTNEISNGLASKDGPTGFGLERNENILTRERQEEAPRDEASLPETGPAHLAISCAKWKAVYRWPARTKHK